MKDTTETKRDPRHKRQGRRPERRAARLFSSVELTLVRKDLHAIWRRNGIRALLMAMPAVLIMVIPLLYSVAISLLPVTETQPPEQLRAMISAETAGHGYRQFWMDAFATLICPMLFLCVPIVCAVASASCVFVSEKENHTLETLLLTSMGARSVFNTKVTVCVLLSVAVSVVSFLVFAITMSVADIMISAPYFFSLEWLVTLFLLMPAVSLFSVVFVTLLLHKVKTVGESLQTMGYLILPFAVLFLLQFTGLFRVNVFFLGFLAILLFAAACVLFNASARRFQPDTLFAGPSEA